MRRNRARLIKLLLVTVVAVVLVKLLSSGGGTTAPSDSDGPAERDVQETVLKAKAVFDSNEPPEFSWDDLRDNPLKDWHDLEAMERDAKRTGPGEQGAPVVLNPMEEKSKHALFSVNGFNGLASDKIALDRAINDIRHGDCKDQKYRSRLPSVSLVIPFHNEHWSTLLRTVTTCTKRAPPGLIKEVFLADDFSTKDFLKEKLDNYVRENFKNVHIVRAKKREGLIRTRLLGARPATGQVLIFLDSHCECSVNWLPPLLDPIAADYRTAVCPFIDVLDFETFQYRAQDEGARGAFDWEMFYKRLPLLPDDLQHPARPFKSPVMAGGLFAISSKFFWELGGYDPGLDIWGAEQYELSFKIWQCHGQMVDAPCSRIGHVYRKFAPFANPGVGDFMGRNHKRVAEVWMDEYKEFIYKRKPHMRNINAGDLKDQLAIREKLKCKSFKWFMTEIAFDLPKVYPPVEPPNAAEGELRNEGSDLCVDTQYRGSGSNIVLEKCIKDGNHGGEQNIVLSWHRDIRPNKRSVCLDVSTSVDKAPIILFNCHNMRGNQLFKYNVKTRQIIHPVSNQCMDSDEAQKSVFMRQCDPSKASQRWKWLKTDTHQLEMQWNMGKDDV